MKSTVRLSSVLYNIFYGCLADLKKRLKTVQEELEKNAMYLRQETRSHTCLSIHRNSPCINVLLILREFRQC